MTAPAQSRQDPDAQLIRGLGVRQLAAAVFNYTVGTGIFVLPAYAAAALGGAAWLSYGVCAVIMGLVALCFAEAGSRVVTTGGPYVYVGAALGPIAGFLAGVILWLTELASGAAVGTLLGTSVLAMFGIKNSPLLAGAIVAVTFAVLAAINIRGLKAGSRTMEFVTAFKLIPLIGFVAIGLFYVNGANLAWGTTPTAANVFSTSGILVFAFAGIEGALIPSGEVRAPARTVPRAAIMGLGAVTLLYCGVHFVAQGVLGPALVNDKTAPLATAAQQFLGPVGRSIMLVAVVVSVLGHLSSAILAAPRAPFALGRDGFLPAALAAVHPVFRTPYVAIAVHTLIVIALALSGTFTQLAVLANVSLLTVYFVCAVSVWVLRKKDVRADGEPFRIWGGPLIPLFTCVATGWVIWATVTQRELIAVASALFAATLLYSLRAWRSRAA